MQAFISYSSHDLELVKVLATNLENALSISTTLADNVVWFDQDLVGGQDWWDQILSKIRSSDFIVFAVSKKSILSDPCSRELAYAEALHRQILPVRITSETIKDIDLPAAVGHIEYIDFSEPDKTESFLKLVAAVKKLADAVEPLPDPLPEPPAIPISPLTEISHKLRETTLTREEQLDMYDRLRSYLSDPDEAKDARDLLLRLQKHDDVRAAIRDDIIQLLKNTPELKRQSATVTPAPVNQTAQPLPDPFMVAPVPPSKPKTGWFRMNGRTIGLVFGVLYGLMTAADATYCGFDIYGNSSCDSSAAVALLIVYVITFTLIGWGIDVLLRRIRGNR